MALQDKFDSEFTNTILKRTLMGAGSVKTAPTNDNVIIAQNDIVKISNSLTSLQNAFNKIYAHSLNVRNLNQYEEKRLQSIKRESKLESLAAPSIANPQQTQSTLSTEKTVQLFDDLSKSIENLTDKIDRLNLNGDNDSALGGAAAAAAGRGRGQRALPAGAGGQRHRGAHGGGLARGRAARPTHLGRRGSSWL